MFFSSWKRNNLPGLLGKNNNNASFKPQKRRKQMLFKSSFEGRYRPMDNPDIAQFDAALCFCALKVPPPRHTVGGINHLWSWIKYVCLRWSGYRFFIHRLTHRPAFAFKCINIHRVYFTCTYVGNLAFCNKCTHSPLSNQWGMTFWFCRRWLGVYMCIYARTCFHIHMGVIDQSWQIYPFPSLRDLCGRYE